MVKNGEQATNKQQFIVDGQTAVNAYNQRQMSGGYGDVSSNAYQDQKDNVIKQSAAAATYSSGFLLKTQAKANEDPKNATNGKGF